MVTLSLVVLLVGNMSHDKISSLISFHIILKLSGVVRPPLVVVQLSLVFETVGLSAAVQVSEPGVQLFGWVIVG